MQDVFVISAVRTAIGTFGGSLKDHSPTALGAVVTKEAVMPDEVVFVDAIPIGATGKVDKKLIRKEALLSSDTRNVL